jgi:hypothetical protein
VQCVSVNQAMRAYPRTITGGLVQNGWVYVIETDDAIKVGWTQDPFERIRWYRRNVDEYLYIWWLSPGTRYDEQRLLDRYRHLLLRGKEWFKPDSEIRLDCDSERIATFLYQGRLF